MWDLIVSVPDHCLSFYSDTGDDATLSSYTCANDFEGTSLTGMNSDLDKVTVMEDFPVVTDISDAQQSPHGPGPSHSCWLCEPAACLQRESTVYARLRSNEWIHVSGC